MASDYDRIRMENIKEYGEGVRHLAFLGRLYTDRTQFIYELLQNAEDADATIVRFSLRRDQLEVQHNGRPFDEHDVRGICGVGEGTKAEDFTKIGKFGIGFKSVYAYTASPEIHSGDEHFRIENYVRPVAHPADPLEDPWTTLFVFKFEHTEVSPQQAHREIGARLQRFEARILLFLRHIATIRWDIEGGAWGMLHRRDHQTGMARTVSITNRTNALESVERWCVFEQSLSVPEREESVRVEVAFRLTRDKRTGEEHVIPIRDSQLVAYFPTEKETRLGFLIQGPYRTTPARDNIPKDDAWNERLIRQTARLLVSALPELREMGLLTISLLDTLPTRSSDFPADGMFYPFFVAVRDSLRDQPLLPTYGGSFVAARAAKLARSAELLDQLSPQQLGDLVGRDESLHWLSPEISEARTPDLRRYLMGNRPFWYRDVQTSADLVDDVEVRPVTVARNVTYSFMTKQDDAWVGKLYAFFGGHRDAWSTLRERRFVRLQDRRHVPPFESNGSPYAYLPIGDDTESDFPTVKREVVENNAARTFLQEFGLKEPDTVSEVLLQVLPKYHGNAAYSIPDDEHDSDIQKIMYALQTESLSSRTALIQHLRDIPFLRAVNLGTRGRVAMPPSSLYVQSPDLTLYFAGNPDVWFLDDRYANLHQISSLLGIRDRVAVVRRQSDGNGHVVISAVHGKHQRGLDGFDPQFRFDGLDHAIKNMTVDKARFIWNEMLPNYWRSVKGAVESSSRQSYENAQREVRFSVMGKLLTRSVWLPHRNGGMKKPGDLSLDDLPDGFKRHDRLAAALRMKPAVLDELARRYDIATETLRFALEHREEIEELRRQHEEQAEINDKDTAFNQPPVDYSEALSAAFNRPGRGEELDSFVEPGPVANPGLRRERIQADIQAARSLEPSGQQRFKRVPTKVWEAKDNRARTFLLVEYSGKCQICNASFRKRSGEPYFRRSLSRIPYLSSMDR